MKKFSIIIAIIIVSFIIQTSLFNFFNILGTVPNISLILVVIFALMTNGIAGGILGILTGVMYDTMIYDVFGIYTLIYFFIGSIIGTYNDYILRENYVAYSTITALSTVVWHFLLYVILFFMKYRVGSASNILSNIFIEIIFNAVMVIFVHKLINLIFDKLSIK